MHAYSVHVPLQGSRVIALRVVLHGLAYAFACIQTDAQYKRHAPKTHVFVDLVVVVGVVVVAVVVVSSGSS